MSDPRPDQSVSSWPLVELGSCAGYVFHAESADDFCFVPVDCVGRTQQGEPVINDARYFLSGWCLRNVRQGREGADGNFCFPDAGRPVADLADPQVRAFLSRIQRSVVVA